MGEATAGLNAGCASEKREGAVAERTPENGISCAAQRFEFYGSSSLECHSRRAVAAQRSGLCQFHGVVRGITGALWAVVGGGIGQGRMGTGTGRRLLWSWCYPHPPPLR